MGPLSFSRAAPGIHADAGGDIQLSFVEIAKSVPTRTCVIGGILEGLPEDEAAALAGMLASPIDTWPHTGEGSIQASFKAEGYSVGDKAIRAHRANACRCNQDNA